MTSNAPIKLQLKRCSRLASTWIYTLSPNVYAHTTDTLLLVVCALPRCFPANPRVNKTVNIPVKDIIGIS